jgi:ubiquitin-like-conjugating enzyme ATG10
MLSNLPHLTPPKFDQACTSLITKFDCHGHKQNKWQSVELISQNSTKYLRITRLLPHDHNHSASSATETVHAQDHDLEVNEEQDQELGEGTEDELEIDDDDDQALTTEKCSVVVNHDIHLSPTYSLPILYTHITDPQHRFPPTMDTLYRHLIPPHFKAQTKITGVMGGVTVADHPATGRPVFVVHACRTAEVLEACVGEGVGVDDYLLLWIGALGGCVGLSVPLGLMAPSDEESLPA